MNAKFFLALLGGAATLSLTSAAQEDERGRRRTVALLVDVEHPLDESHRRQHRAVLSRPPRLREQARSRVRRARAQRHVHLSRCRAALATCALCDSDSITVLETSGRGFNCGLGLFEPISAEEVESFVSGPNPAIVTDARRAAEGRRTGRACRGTSRRSRARSAMKKAGPLARPGPSDHELSGRASRECRGA